MSPRYLFDIGEGHTHLSLAASAIRPAEELKRNIRSPMLRLFEFFRAPACYLSRGSVIGKSPRDRKRPVATNRERFAASRPRKENRQTEFLGVIRPIALGIVHGLEVDVARAQLGIGDGHGGVATSADGHHHAVLALLDAV